MRLKKKNFFIALVILTIILIELINPFKLISSIKIRNLNYSRSSSYKIIDYGLKDEVLNNEYSEFIDKSVSSDEFIKDNYSIYKDLVYKKDIKLYLINQLIIKEYNSEEINCIINTGNNTSIKDLLSKEKYDKITEFLAFDYADLANLDRYFDYQRKTLNNYKDTVLYVELNLDKEFYTDALINNEFSYTMLLNKYNGLDKDFVPDKLVEVKSEYSYNGKNTGNEKMLNNFYLMADALNKEIDLKIYVRSAYRDYNDQDKVYNEYLKLYGTNYVKKYVAYPGFSEHQTGLAVDIKASSSDIFANTKESNWLKKNAHKYGFILRYPKSLVNVTGYQNEEWHYRYVGEEIATYIYEKGVSFDEYYIRFIRNK